MSVHYVGFSIAKPGKDAELGEFMETRVMPAVRASDGCLSCQFLQDNADPHKYMLVEIWSSLAAHKASIQNISQDDIARFMELVAEPPTGSHYHLLAAF